MTDFRETLRGIVAMLVSSFFFIVADTIVKVAAGNLPLGEVLFIRSVIALVMVFAVVWKMGLLDGLLAQTSRPVVIRSVAEALSTVAYLGGLMHLPIANAASIGQATPLAMIAGGALIFREKVGWRRWLAVLVGFVGILVIVRPGPSGFNLWALAILASVGFTTVRELATRFVAPTTNAVIVTLMTQVAVTIACGGLAVTEVWQPVSLSQIALITAGAITCLIAIQISVDAMRHGDISLVAQFRYSFIPYSIAVGWLVFGDVPDLVTLVGIVIVAASGVMIFMIERARQRKLMVALASA